MARSENSMRGETCTYFIQGEISAQVKIGRTRGDAERRRKDLQTGSAEPLKLLGTLPGDLESSLHTVFKELRSAGEWFQLKQPLIGFLRGCGFIPISPKPQEKTIKVCQDEVDGAGDPPPLSNGLAEIKGDFYEPDRIEDLHALMSEYADDDHSREQLDDDEQADVDADECPCASCGLNRFFFDLERLAVELEGGLFGILRSGDHLFILCRQGSFAKTAAAVNQVAIDAFWDVDGVGFVIQVLSVTKEGSWQDEGTLRAAYRR